MELDETNFRIVEEDFEKLNLSVTATANGEADAGGCGEEEEGEETGGRPAETTKNRRCSLRPRKRLCGEFAVVDMSPAKMKTFKSESSASLTSKRGPYLETIFEEPIVKKNGSVVLLGSSKIKRSITFPQFVTKTKARKRKALLKKFKFGKKKKLNLTLNDLKKKLSHLDDSPVRNPAND